MTTIAYRDGVLAADSQVTANGVIRGSTKKIARAEDGTLVSVSGRAAVLGPFLEWVIGGLEGERPEMEGARGIIYRTDGMLDVHEEDGNFVLDVDFYADGSGEEFALAAMALGKSPEEAVGVASQFDIHTGGDIVVLYRDVPPET